MSSTRYSAAGSPVSQERYASSPEFGELRGVHATAVAFRASVLDTSEQKALVWFLQGRSLEPGGLKRVAEELLEMFPDRRLNPKPSKCNQLPEPLEATLLDLCINPAIRFAGNLALSDCDQINLARVRREHPDVSNIRWLQSGYLRDLGGALLEYKRRFEESAASAIDLTSNGRGIWECLDLTLRRTSIVLIEGREGFGKSASAKAWCQMHLGRARFVSLQAVISKTTFFRELARALGVACGPGRKSCEMQNRVEEVLKSSRLALVIDEAHWLFGGKSTRVYTRPELVDWIGTLNNHGVSVGLVATPQFLKNVAQSVKQTGWNWNQFRRRVKKTIQLKPTPPEEIGKVVQRLLPESGSEGSKLIVNYAVVSGRDMSGMADLVEASKQFAAFEGRSKTCQKDIRAALKDLAGTDAIFSQVQRNIEGKGAKRRQRSPLEFDRQSIGPAPDSSNRLVEPALAVAADV